MTELERSIAWTADISASNARIEAMKAENLMRERSNQAPAYGWQSFQEEATFLETIAREIRTP